MGAVRADRGRHDLAVVDDQASADRLDVLVAGDDLALVGGLADLVGAELVGLGESDAGAGGNDESGRGGRDEVRPAAFASTEKAETVLLGTPTACYLH